MFEKNLLRGGDVWIGLEVCAGTRFGVEERPSGGVANLKSYDAKRYAPLNLPGGLPSDWPDLQPGRLRATADRCAGAAKGQAR